MVSNNKTFSSNVRGLQTNLKVAKYRFNQTFHLVNADNFLKDLFNNKTILSTFQPVGFTMNCSTVKYKKMHSQVINMSYFDFLKEKEIVMDDGRIKGDFDEYVDGI